MRRTAYLISLLGLAATLYAADPFLGTWKLNVAKSKVPSNSPFAAKDVTVVAEEKGDLVDVTVKGTAENGSPISVHYTVPKSGGVLKFEQGGPTNDITVTTRRIGNNTMDSVITSADGKQVGTDHSVVSPNGKSLRLSRKGADPQGKPFETVEIYEKP